MPNATPVVVATEVATTAETPPETCSTETVSAGTAVPSSVTGLEHGRALRADARRNRDRLIAAASAAFAETGPDTALEEIARRAGVGIGTLYRHFPTRERLMAAVVRETFEDLRGQAVALLDADDPRAALESWVRSYLTFAKTKRGLIGGLVLLKEEGQEFGGLCDRMFAALDALLVRGQQAGAIRTGISGRDLLHLCSGIAHGAEVADDPGLADRLLDVALAGLRTP